MHKFRVSPGSLNEKTVVLDPKESHHAFSVLRVKPGEPVRLLDGKGGSADGVVASAKKGCVEIAVTGKASVPSGSVEVTLATAVIRPERMEWMLEKACELGAAEWAPMLCERAIVKLSRERWQAKLE